MQLDVQHVKWHSQMRLRGNRSGLHWKARLQTLLYAVGLLYLLLVWLVGWGPWEEDYRYTYTLSRSLASAAIVLWTGLYVVAILKCRGRRFWFGITATLVSAAVVAVALNEERRLRAIFRNADELEFLKIWADLPTPEIAVTIKDPGSIGRIAGAVEFEPAWVLKGTFYNFSDKGADFVIRLKKRGRKTARVLVAGEGRVLRWLPERKSGAFGELGQQLRTPGHGDFEMASRFAEILAAELFAALPDESQFTSDRRATYYYALAWTRTAEAFQWLGREAKLEPERRLEIVWLLFGYNNPPFAPDAVRALMTIAADPVPETRRFAISAIASHEGTALAHQFIAALSADDEPDTNTKLAIIQAKRTLNPRLGLQYLGRQTSGTGNIDPYDL